MQGVYEPITSLTPACLYKELRLSTGLTPKSGTKTHFMGEFTINGFSNQELVTANTNMSYSAAFQLPYSRKTMIRSGQDIFLFQNYVGSFFELWLSEYRTAQPATIYATVERRLLELTFVLRDEMNYTMEGLGNVQMPGSSFNLSHEPYVENRLRLQKGQAITFDIHVSEDYLQALCSRLPGLEPFLNKIAKGVFSLLNTLSQQISVCVQSMIYAILHAGEEDPSGTAYLECQVEALLLRALSELIHQQLLPLKASPQQADTILGVERYLREHYDEHKKTKELAQLFATNEYTLKQLFKEKYGVGVYGFLKNIRLAKAQELLGSTDMSIRDMSFLVGYQNPNCLTEAFKKKFGMTPLQYRLRS